MLRDFAASVKQSAALSCRAKAKHPRRGARRSSPLLGELGLLLFLFLLDGEFLLLRFLGLLLTFGHRDAPRWFGAV
jgi:hypothetical protein